MNRAQKLALKSIGAWSYFLSLQKQLEIANETNRNLLNHVCALTGELEDLEEALMLMHLGKGGRE